MKPSISILGGDLRQVHLAELLRQDGFSVAAWGLEQGGASGGVPLDQALEGDVLLLPLPVCRNGRLFLPLTDTELEAERLWPRLRFDQLLLGGMVGSLSGQLMSNYGLTLLDYYAREETQVANAVPTALPNGHSFFCHVRTGDVLFPRGKRTKRSLKGTCPLENPLNVWFSYATIWRTGCSISSAVGRCRCLLLRTVLSLVLVAARHAAPGLAVRSRKCYNTPGRLRIRRFLRWR